MSLHAIKSKTDIKPKVSIIPQDLKWSVQNSCDTKIPIVFQLGMLGVMTFIHWPICQNLFVLFRMAAFQSVHPGSTPSSFIFSFFFFLWFSISSIHFLP